MKKITALILIIACFCGVHVIAAETCNVTVNGVYVKFDQPPIIEYGRTLVPIRAVMEQIGAEVKWNPATQTVTVLYKNVGIAVQIDNATMVIRDLSTGEERQKIMDVPPKMYEGRTLLPIRAVVEDLGCNVGWDGQSSTVVITTLDYSAPQVQQAIIIGE